MSGDPAAPTETSNKVFRTLLKFGNIIDGPVTMIKENIVDPIRSLREQPVYYHRKFRRVPTLDECQVSPGDVCWFEANEQLKRDKMVDERIVHILRQRMLECQFYHGNVDAPENCAKVVADYEDTATNYFIKYGDTGPQVDCREIYMKQKHRMLWERRHGPVGTGMKDEGEV